LEFGSATVGLGIAKPGSYHGDLVFDHRRALMKKEVFVMQRKSWFLAIVGVMLLLSANLVLADDGFYVIAGSGKSGKVLKTQVFTSTTADSTIGTGVWARLTAPQWTYTKLSSTSTW
jgi:hypothetical protein